MNYKVLNQNGQIMNKLDSLTTRIWITIFGMSCDNQSKSKDNYSQLSDHHLQKDIKPWLRPSKVMAK